MTGIHDQRCGNGTDEQDGEKVTARKPVRKQLQKPR